MKIKHIVGSLLAMAMAFSFVGFIPVDAASVKITKKTFPSKGFRNYVSEEFDKNSDGVLSSSEIKNATSIYLCRTGTSSMTGIKYFTELNYLTIDEPAVKNLNLYYNTKLSYLNVNGSSIKEVKNLSRTQVNTYYPNATLFYNMKIDKLKDTIEIVLSSFPANSSKFNLKYLSKYWNLSKLTVNDGATRSGDYLTNYEEYRQIDMTYKQPDGDKIHVVLSLSFITKPRYVDVYRASSTSVKLDWSNGYGTSGTEVWRATSKSGKYTKVATAGKEKYSCYVKSLKTGKTYYYKLRSYVNLNGHKIYTGYTSPISFKTTLLAPDFIRSEQIYTKDYTYNLKWAKVEGAQGYQIYRATSLKGKYSRVATIDSGSRLAKSFTTSKDYYYKVRGYRVVDGKKVFSPFSDILHVWWFG